MTEIKWQEPAPRSKNGVDWQSIASELRANPGRWALAAEGVYASTTTSINNGRLQAFRPSGSFEAVSRNMAGQKADIYVRFVGEVSA